MKLVRENRDNCNSLIRTHCVGGPNNPLLPGDLIRHWQDQESAGIVIAVSHHAAIGNPDFEALVLWTKLPFRGNYPNVNDSMSNELAGQIRDEIDADILHDLANQGLISKKAIRQYMGVDDDEVPNE